MNLSKSWIIASKDFAIFRKKRSIVYSLIVVPILIAILFPVVIVIAGHRTGSEGTFRAALPYLLPSFSFFYLILAGLIPTTLASYSIVGEKVEKCLEPLLATPTTDGEILLGKGLAAFLPPIVAILGGSALFMAFTDLVTVDTLGYLFFPNWNAVILLFLMVPLAAVMSVEWNVMISSRLSDVRTAQQLGALLALPFGGIYVAGEINLIPLGDTGTLLLIAGVMALVDVLLLPVTRAIFRREEILTRWK